MNIKSGSVWFGIDGMNSSFTGRGTELKKLHEFCTKSDFNPNANVYEKCTVISGLGGIGKSELAKVYAITHRNHYNSNAIWINAETDESLRNSLIHFSINNSFLILFILHINRHTYSQ